MIDTYEIYDISSLDKLSLHFALIKLNEEVGELNAAYLAMENSINKSASSYSLNPNEHFLEEAVDALICTLDIIYKKGYTDDHIQHMISKKSIKWKKKFIID